MKTIYILLLAISFVVLSCNDNLEENNTGSTDENDVELRITFNKSQTRDAVPYPGAAGTEEEKKIERLTLVAFDSTTKQYVYHRPASVSSGGLYRATVPSKYETVDVAVLANCSTTGIDDVIKSTQWASSAKKWEDFQKLLIESNPSRLVNSANFVALPMSSDPLLARTLITTGVADWGVVQLRRSVASVDLLLEKNTLTNKFELLKVHLYNAADKGYLTSIKKASTSPQQYETPTDMLTNLNTLVATRVGETQEETSPFKQYDAVTSQLFMFDNNFITNDIGNVNKCTRIIVEGYYDQTGPVKTPTFYPLFIINGAVFHPVIRNNKYIMIVNEVYGPGYNTIEEAAESSPINMNVKIIDWDLNYPEIGVSGNYYVSISKKAAYLTRKAGSTDEILLAYNGEENDKFSINFKTADNGAQTSIPNGIANDRFEVTITYANGTGKIIAKAKGDFNTTDDPKNHDVVVMTYRNLKFEIPIHQLDLDESDWNDGGNINPIL